MNLVLHKAVRSHSLSFLLALGVVLAAGICGAQPANPASQPVWLISTRSAPRCVPADAEVASLDYWRLIDDEQWSVEDRDAFLAADDPAVPTVFFIHGNRTGRNEAVQAAWHVYRYLREETPDRAFRLVVWSWPADRVAGGNRYDAQVKAARSDVESYYLADCVRRINPDVRLGLVGYSFGARVITGALHLLAGGEVAGYGLGEARRPRRAPIRAVLAAAALDNSWLLPDRRNGMALGQLDQVLVTRNRCDPVLRFYPLMYRLRGPQALGYTGPACPAWLGPEGEKIELLSVDCQVGKAHEWSRYFHALAAGGRLAWYTLVDSAKPDVADAPDKRSHKGG